MIHLKVVTRVFLFKKFFLPYRREIFPSRKKQWKGNDRNKVESNDAKSPNKMNKIFFIYKFLCIFAPYLIQYKNLQNNEKTFLYDVGATGHGSRISL
jgi:hypothetical protein